MFQTIGHYHNVSLQLSEILDDIGVNQRLVERRRKSFLLVEGLHSVSLKFVCGDPTRLFMFGSQTEASTTVGLKSDIDQLFVFNYLKVLPDWSVWEPFDGFQCLMLHDLTTAPGYCLLQCVGSHEPLPVQESQANHCTKDCRGRVLLKHSFCLVYIGGETVRHGPAGSRTFGYYSSDYVTAFFCSSWPKEANYWLQQQNASGWPTEDMKRFAEQSGSFLVPVASRDSEHEDTEWRISTSLAERCLMFSLNMTQLRCYVLMKMILKSFLHPEFEDCMTSFICKTVLFHCIADSTGIGFWCDHNLLMSLNTCFQRLLHCILTENCPHFIIPGNNLLRGKLSPGVKQRLVEKLCSLTGDIVRALTAVSTDDLGIRLSTKLCLFTYIILPAKDDIYETVVLKNYAYVFCFLKKGIIITQTVISRQRQATIHGKLRHCISKMCQTHTLGSVFERKACMILMQHLFTTLGSVIASDDIAQGRGLSPESLTWFSAGLDSDVATSRLKLASALYCAGEFGRCELILNDLETKLNLLRVYFICTCSRPMVTHGELPEDVYDKNEWEVIKENVAFCVKYLPSETCIPVELKYELVRLMNSVTVDALPYFYFLQYKVYRQLHKPADQRRALDNLSMIIYSDPGLGHKETALNILGQCYEQENKIRHAMCCYMMSLNVRNINNAARLHICRLLASLFRQSSDT